MEQGGTVIIGPRRPSLDQAMRPLARGFPGHALATHETIADFLTDLVEKLDLDCGPYADSEAVEITHYEGGQDWVIFAANQGDTSCTSAIRGLDFDGRWLWDALSGDPVNPSCIHLEGKQVRMLRSRPAATGPLPKIPRPGKER